MYKLGDKKKFNPPQKGIYELKEIVTMKLALQWTWFLRVCPHCQREINETKIHNINEVHIWARTDGKDVIMISPTTDGRYMRLPDKKFETGRSLVGKVKPKVKTKELKEKL